MDNGVSNEYTGIAAQVSVQKGTLVCYIPAGLLACYRGLSLPDGSSAAETALRRRIRPIQVTERAGVCCICTMKLILQSDNIEDYLAETDVVDFGSENIRILAAQLHKPESALNSGTVPVQNELIKMYYEFVRDKIHHSLDIPSSVRKTACTASEVLEKGQGALFCKVPPPCGAAAQSENTLRVLLPAACVFGPACAARPCRSLSSV